MKNLLLFTSIVFTVLFTGTAFAQKNKTEDIKVWGNCGMCQKTIEAAALKGGASTASWNKETKVLTIAYNQKKSDSKAIQEAVAASGYDTQDFTAPTDAYKNLHSCCQYDRKVVDKSPSSDKMECNKDAKCDKDMACCKGENDMTCCKEGKCDKDMACCKDEKCDKGTGSSTDKACCKK
jgi:hypothetical protein